MSMKCMRCGKDICIDESLCLCHMGAVDANWNFSATSDEDLYLCQECAEGMMG